jgi:hypothetical protein
MAPARGPHQQDDDNQAQEDDGGGSQLVAPGEPSAQLPSIDYREYFANFDARTNDQHLMLRLKLAKEHFMVSHVHVRNQHGHPAHSGTKQLTVPLVHTALPADGRLVAQAALHLDPGPGACGRLGRRHLLRDSRRRAARARPPAWRRPAPAGPVWRALVQLAAEAAAVVRPDQIKVPPPASGGCQSRAQLTVVRRRRPAVEQRQPGGKQHSVRLVAAASAELGAGGRRPTSELALVLLDSRTDRQQQAAASHELRRTERNKQSPRSAACKPRQSYLACPFSISQTYARRLGACRPSA